MNLTSEERETIIRFDEAGPLAVVYTYNVAWKNKLAKMASERPDEVCFKEEDGWGGVTYELPKKWLKIGSPRAISDAQRQAMVEHAAKYLTPRTPASAEA